jgi:hypothetical protein
MSRSPDIQATCWAYADDGRICRSPSTVFDPQRGFFVCAAHSEVRENQKQTPNRMTPMSKSKSPPALPNGTASTTEQPNYRNNPEVDAKIDAYIRENGKFWAYVQGLSKERLERMVVLHEVQKIDRQQRMRDGIMNQINRNPELKQAYDILVKNVPEEQRENVMLQIANQARRTIARSQSIAH